MRCLATLPTRNKYRLYRPFDHNVATWKTMHITGAVVTEVSVVLPPSSASAAGGGNRSSELRHFPTFTDSTSFISPRVFNIYPSICTQKLEPGLYKCRSRSVLVRASANSSDNVDPIAPLQFTTVVGQFLAQILQTHPHLISSAIDQQLENLQTDKDAQKVETPGSSKDILYRRIAEVREKERQRSLEEIIYCLIVHKFIDKNISMTPKISSTSDPTGRVDFWPNQVQKLESVHSPEALEMIQSHLALVLGERVVGPLSSDIQISKIKLGKLYAASIMYGYFLRRVDERFQLERSMKTLPEGFIEDRINEGSPVMKGLYDPESLIAIYPDEEGGGLIEHQQQGKQYRLRSYVMYLDADTLQKYATIRSREAISLIEKQTQALFGRPDIKIGQDGAIDTSNDEVIGITFSGLTMLILEAAAFGSFLWDAEGYVESKYHFLKN